MYVSIGFTDTARKWTWAYLWFSVIMLLLERNIVILIWCIIAATMLSIDTYLRIKKKGYHGDRRNPKNVEGTGERKDADS